MRDEDRTMIDRTPAARLHTLRTLSALVGLSVMLGACNTGAEIVTASVPDDYRLRHPISIREADRSITVFVGQARGGLSASQRADVMGMANLWVSEGTGAIVAEVPVDTPNARAAESSFREIRAALTAGGVPARGVVLRRYRPDDPLAFGTIRLSYPRVAAVAGPCGQWPEDIGLSVLDSGYHDNKPYYNFGCANQRNLAAMVDNPSDLVQPRSETPAYTARRTASFGKYRKGESTATVYPEAEKGKLSDTDR
jgi:pilus assembly protein CpaD